MLVSAEINKLLCSIMAQKDDLNLIKSNALLYPWTYNGTRVCRSGHEQDMVSPLAQEIFSPHKQDMASPQHKEPIKYINIYI